jgi:hypothetical protein
MPNTKKATKTNYSQRVYAKTLRIRKYVDEHDRMFPMAEAVQQLHEALSEARGLVALLEADLLTASLQSGEDDLYSAPQPITAANVPNAVREIVR